LEILEGVLDAIVNLSPCPHIAVFELLEDIELPGSFLGILLPATPVGIIVEIILSWTGLEDLIPGFGPGKIVLDFSHCQP